MKYDDAYGSVVVMAAEWVADLVAVSVAVWVVDLAAVSVAD